MHGFIENSDVFLDAGPGTGLAYLLADSCFDVWVGNCRGNNYGRAHVTLNPDKDAAFWKFSLDEMGYYDVPAQIDYILKNTRFDKLNYVGFSQGGGIILVANSERPEYNNKVNVIVGIAPATRVTNTKSPLLKLLFRGVFKLEDFFSVGGIQEVLFRGSAFQTFLEFLCQMKSVLNLPYELCKGFLYILDSYHPNDGITPETTRRLYSHFPSGTSAQLVSRYGQSLDSPVFKKYDFGSSNENLAHYGNATPPVYNLSKVTTPVVITYGLNDHVIDPLDINWLKEQLPNVLEVKKVDDPNWNHVDNVYSTKFTTLVYPTVFKYLSQYTTK